VAILTRRGPIIMASIALLVAVAAAAWPPLDRTFLGLPGFFAWKALSGRWSAGHYARIRGVRIYYETYGHGPPVLALHGGPGFLETMHYQICALAGRRRVIAPDSRGQGRSTDGPGPLHYATMTDDMVALLDVLGIRTVDVVGVSDGGIIGLDMAMRYPTRIRRLVAIGANYDVSGLPASSLTTNADPNGPRLTSIRDFYEILSPEPGHWPVFWAKIEHMWAMEPNFSLADLSRIRAPTLIIAGEHDLIRRAHTDALARAIPGAREVIIPGAGHLAPVTNPLEVDAAIVKFLDGKTR